MADSETGLYLISYDIAHPKRLVRVHRLLKKYGLPVQYSVFTVVMKRPALLKLLDALGRVIHARRDDMRCYRLPGQPQVISLGRQFFPTQVYLYQNGVNQFLSRSD